MIESGTGEGNGWEGDPWCHEEYVSEPPDAVALVTEVANLMSVFAADRLIRVDAMRREAFACAARRGGRFTTEIVLRSVRLELAAALRISEYSAGQMIGLAEALVHRYPTALDALHRAEMTERHAQILADSVDAVEPEHRDAILPVAVELARTRAVGVFRAELNDLISRVRAVSSAERHAAALLRRRVLVEPADDGMAWLLAHVPAVEAHAVMDRLNRMAKAIRSHDDEKRSLDQIRADLVGDLLIEGDTAALPVKARGIRATVVVTVPALSLLGDPAGAPDDAPERTSGHAAGAGADGGADVVAGSDGDGGADVVAGSVADHGADDAAGSAAVGREPIDPARPGTDRRRGCPVRAAAIPVVEGLGPIPLERARELCGGDAAWMRVLTHPETGIVLSVGRDRYDPPPALRRLTRWRADRCMAPGCRMPASRCEIDHTLAWEHGGSTSLENLAPICKGHHTIKHHGGWRVDQVGGGGALEWTSPTGRRYRVEPTRRVPVFHHTDASDAPF